MAVTVVLAGTVGLVSGVPALAQSTGTTELSTKKADAIAMRYGLLRTSDLPDAYAHTNLQRDTGYTPRSVSVIGDCDDINPAVAWTGPKPVTTGAEFAEETPGTEVGGEGVEIVSVFPQETSARAYYRAFAGGLDELAECGLMASPTGAIGTYAGLGVGKGGDERTGVSFEPRGNEEYGRIAIARSGTTFVYLELRDDDATDSEFRTLVKAALKRAP